MTISSKTCFAKPPEDAKMFGIDEFRLFDSDEKYIGKLYGGHYHDADRNEYFLEFVYFTKATKVTCDNAYKKFDINAGSGWNKIYVKDPDSDACEDGPNGKEICKAIVSTNNFFTKEVKFSSITALKSGAEPHVQRQDHPQAYSLRFAECHLP